tara:strand:+ start:4242 stop:5921 length:1680 start_codon:yes stop_codon:yes gene_type:complete
MSYRNPNQIAGVEYGKIAQQAIDRYTETLNNLVSTKNARQDAINKQVLLDKIKGYEALMELNKQNTKRLAEIQLEANKAPNEIIRDGFMQAYSVNLDNTHTNAVLTSEQKAENVSNINGAPNISNLLTDYGSLEKLYEGLTVGNGPGQVSVGQKNYVWRAMQKLKNPNTPSSELQGGTYSTPTSGNVPYMSVGVDGERITFDGATLKQYTNNPNAAVQVIDNWTGFVNTAVSDIVYDKNGKSNGKFRSLETTYQVDKSGRAVNVQFKQVLDREAVASAIYQNTLAHVIGIRGSQDNPNLYAQADLWNSVEDYNYNGKFDYNIGDNIQFGLKPNVSETGELEYINSGVELNGEQAEALAKKVIDNGLKIEGSKFDEIKNVNATAAQLFKVDDDDNNNENYTDDLSKMELFKQNLNNAITSNTENAKNFFLNKKIGGKFVNAVEFPIFDGDKYLGSKDIVFTVREGVSSEEEKFTKRRYDTTSPEQMRLLAQELYQFNTNKNSLSQGEMKALLTLFPIGQPYRLSSVGVNQTGSPITLPNSGETPTISYSGTAEELINNVD